MALALEQARAAAAAGEVPVGAVVVIDGEVVAKAGNLVIARHDPAGHAELRVIRQACTVIGSERLPDADLYVTLEPCAMCAALISYARIRRLYYGAEDKKSGGSENGVRFFNDPSCHHKPEIISGIREQECAELLTRFFADRRH
jgi:tRNA(Arg) A34 adenosine deaminase TadA